MRRNNSHCELIFPPRILHNIFILREPLSHCNRYSTEYHWREPNPDWYGRKWLCGYFRSEAGADQSAGCPVWMRCLWKFTLRGRTPGDTGTIPRCGLSSHALVWEVLIPDGPVWTARSDPLHGASILSINQEAYLLRYTAEERAGPAPFVRA